MADAAEAQRVLDGEVSAEQGLVHLRERVAVVELEDQRDLPGEAAAATASSEPSGAAYALQPESMASCAW
jgi:hypothetical protein